MKATLPGVPSPEYKTRSDSQDKERSLEPLDNKSPSHKPGLLQAKLKLALANHSPHLLSINGLHEIQASHLPANGGKMRQLPEELQHFRLISRA